MYTDRVGRSRDERLAGVLADDVLRIPPVPSATPAARLATVLTVGHSNHPLERFVALLTAYDAEVVVDVRSHPYSRFAP